MAKIPKRFGILLKSLRRSWHLTQEGLVNKIRKQPGYEERFDKSSISRWENSKAIPDYETVEVLEDIFELKGQELLKAAEYVRSENNTISSELFNDIIELAVDLRALIYVPIVIPVSESLSSKIAPNSDEQGVSQTVSTHFSEYLASDPFKQALYNQFIALPSSEKFKVSLENWKQKTDYYYRIAGTTNDIEEVNKAYKEAKESAEQALFELAEAVESLRWNQ